MDPLLFTVLLLLGFVVAFAIGSNDEAMAPAVGAGVLSLNIAVVVVLPCVPETAIVYLSLETKPKASG